MIIYLDIEYDEKTNIINDFGAIKDDKKTFHHASFKKFRHFIKGADFYCGHKIVDHDAKYINKANKSVLIEKTKCIDTLLLSTLLFPNKPYHRLTKDDKLLPDDSNNPLDDSKNAMALFHDEIYAFQQLSETTKQIYYKLLKDVPGYTGFFNYINFYPIGTDIIDLIREEYAGMICTNCNLEKLVEQYPIELAYSLALTKTEKLESLFPRWVIHNYPFVEQVILQLRGTPCQDKCGYCVNNLDPLLKAKSLFNFDSFKEFDGKPLQELAINAALHNKSLIAVFPTGGGKSFTYQLPALIRGENTRSLTVIISPLQSLMKDQVDNLMGKSINKAVALYGLLDPIERSKNIQRVIDGEVSILYIAPESLRSKTIERLLLSRDIARFVIDEAHCFSTWGQDFRVDYLYIGDFIKNLQDKKNNNKIIPVSCFTATAKKNVITDIENYFAKKLNLKMEKITSSSARKNLNFEVFNLNDEQEKFDKLRSLLNLNGGSTIIYASRTKKIDEIYLKLKEDGYEVSKFHGRMDSDEKIKEQNMFMNDESRIMVATSAFGMGVDKSDISMVIHYEISNSLENYVQEAGRAGRDQSMNADCYVLYNEQDLDKHFNLLNTTKINIKEIQQIWSGIKKMTNRKNKTVSKSTLEIANAAGWEENVRGLQTRVTTAVAALEDAGYIKRGQNSPRVYADGILSNSMAEAAITIENSKKINGKDVELAKRVTKSLISNKYRKRSVDIESEARVDYMADMLGIEIKEVVRIIELLREENILSDSKDLTCYIKESQQRTSNKLLKDSNKLERFLLQEFSKDSIIYNFKEINERATVEGLKSNIKMLKSVTNYLDITNVIDLQKIGNNKFKVVVHGELDESLQSTTDRFILSEYILNYLYKKSEKEEDDNTNDSKAILFSIQELKKGYSKNKNIFGDTASIKQIENALYYLKILESIKIEGGFLVIYSRISIKRLDKGYRYTKKDYEKLESHYQNKVEQIHIVGEYAKKMASNYKEALEFVNDYFNIDYNNFLKKYFKGDRKKEITKKISPSKFKQLFGELSPEQLEIVKDQDSDRIAVAAGPGSGKTKLLVHKLASISLMEDIRSDQMLMLTFSRAAVVEFKLRLLDLLGPAAHYIEINTFHSYCFDIIGRIGSLEQSSDIIDKALTMIENNEVDESKITKSMLVIDEAQDMVEKEYELVKKLLDINENIRLIAVGDDNQNIYEFRNSSNKFFKEISENSNKKYVLPHNFRSKKNLVEFSNKFVETIPDRMKKIPIISKQNDNGEIVIIQHTETELYMPIYKHLENAKLTGKTCILTRTNEQASIMAGMLNDNGMKAELIQENSDLSLFSLYEMRMFYDVITEGSTNSVISNAFWENKKAEFLKNNKTMVNMEVVINSLKEFEQTQGKIKYLSDFREFLSTSNYDDFIDSKELTVATLHKSKGREFDNVIILYDRATIYKNEHKRLLYVGITRAKTKLFIHYYGKFFKYSDIENYRYHCYEKTYSLPDKLVFSTTHKNVNLGYFKFTQKTVLNIEIGTNLELVDNWKFQYNGRKVLQLSKKYIDFIEKFEEKGFNFESATVKHKVYWYSQEMEEEFLIILPEITLVTKDAK